MSGRRLQVSVIGSGPAHEAVAVEVGRLLAERGCVVLTGGLDEVMAWALRGAKQAGGTTIVILPGESHAAANEWADHVVVTGIGHARDLAVAASGDAVIAVGGSWGTLAEIAFAVNEKTENIGARRLYTVLEKLVEDVSFSAGSGVAEGDVRVRIDAQYVDARLGELARNEDLARYVL